VLTLIILVFCSNFAFPGSIHLWWRMLASWLADVPKFQLLVLVLWISSHFHVLSWICSFLCVLGKFIYFDIHASLLQCPACQNCMSAEAAHGVNQGYIILWPFILVSHSLKVYSDENVEYYSPIFFLLFQLPLSIVLFLVLPPWAACYVVGSISFRPDIQRPRQMQNALRGI